MKRVRNKPCSTRQAKKDFARVARIGDIVKIEGVRYTAMFKGNDGLYPLTNEVVRVKGRNGTARFHGVLWGYSGEGPHGLRDLLMFCGVKKNHAEHVAFHMPRRQVDGVDWTLELNGVDGLNRPGWVILTPAGGEKRGWKREDALMEVHPYKLIAWE